MRLFPTISAVSRLVSGWHWMNEPPPQNKAYVPTRVEHVANMITHGLWVLPSIMATAFLVRKAVSGIQFWSAMVYGSSLVLLFSVSTFFHCVFYYDNGSNSRLKELLHRGDRAMIYIFIAASSFPWLSLRPVSNGGFVTTELPWIMWLIASLGILYQQLYHERFKWLEVVFYIITGMLPSLAVFQMEDLSGVTELKIGGIIYIVGVIFFKADGRIPCAHAIWHLHVGVAAAFHYYAVFQYLIGH